MYCCVLRVTLCAPTPTIDIVFLLLNLKISRSRKLSIANAKFLPPRSRRTTLLTRSRHTATTRLVLCMRNATHCASSN